MRLWELYLETSVFGFYFESGAHNADKVVHTRKLFRQIKEGLVLAYHRFSQRANRHFYIRMQPAIQVI